MRRPTRSRSSRRGIFRGASQIPWQRRSRLAALLGASSIRAQDGQTSGVATSHAVAKKVVSIGGTCSAVASSAGTAVKRMAQAGSATVVAADQANQAKVATPRGDAVAASTSSSGYLRISTERGTTIGAAYGRSRVTHGQPALGIAVTQTALPITKRVAEAGSTIAVATSVGKALRVARVGGVCASLAVSAGKAVRVAPQAGKAEAAGTVTVRFAARVTGRGIALGSVAGQAAKRGVERGSCAGLATSTGTAGRRTAQAGRTISSVAAFGIAKKRQPQFARCTGVAFSRGFPVAVGPDFGTRISPPLGILDGPIAGSRIVWSATLDGGTLQVETSIDNGATWQVVQSGQSIPRLLQGDNRTARTVMTRVTLGRASAFVPSPRLHRLEVEVAVDSSREEVCPIGVFTLNDTEIVDSAAGIYVEISGADLARKVSRNRWDDTYIIEAGTNYGTAIQDLIRNRMPDATFNFASTERTTPRLFFGEQSSNDPWQDAQDMARAIGYELFFDARGICTLRPEPDPEVGQSVWEFEDSARPTMTDLRRRVSDENTYNKVVVTGEGTSNDVPVRGVAIDDDPSSPTYYLGPYGTVTYRVTSSLVTTNEQAQDAADALLLRVKGATEAVAMSAVPMPALEPGDVVGVTRAAVKVQGRFLIDQLRIPLGADQDMRAVGRRQRQ